MGGFGFNKQKSKSSSGTKFNTAFLDSFEERYGGPPDVGAMQQGPTSAFTPEVQQGIQNLGFGQAPEKTTAPTVQAERIGEVPLADAPLAGAERARANLIDVSAQNLGAYERAAFGSQFRPVAREFDRQATEQRDLLQSQVAGAGLGSSAAGIGMMQRQAADQTAQRSALAAEAADRAATQRYGFEADAARLNQAAQQETALANQREVNQIRTGNAERQQQVNLARAGFDFEGQKANAGNVLAGDLANSQNYLAAIGLDANKAQEARSSFLQLVGLQSADLERMDNAARGNIQQLANFWLQTFGAVIEASKYGYGSSSGFGFSIAGEK